MSDLLPLFPLPNVVLFPNVFLPLHIFEPRYREMVADALASDRMIGMVLLRPGWERDYEGRPPVYPIGCSGVITHVERLADGRYNIVLRGVERFRIVPRGPSRSYRRGVDRAAARAAAQRATIAPPFAASPLEARVAAGADGSRRAPASPTHAVVDGRRRSGATRSRSISTSNRSRSRRCSNSACLRARAESLVELLEMKMLMARTPGMSHVAH